jgi:hypothetical protein
MLDSARGGDVEQLGSGGGGDALHRRIVPPCCLPIIRG